MTNTSQHQTDRKWETFAGENPFKYILSESPPDALEAFWRSGEEVVSQELLPLLGNYDVGRRLALEIGCGVGRLAIPLSTQFDRVIGLDVSQNMVQHAKAIASQRGVANAVFLTTESLQNITNLLATWRGKVDFAYSLLVFQHVENFTTIAKYVEAIGEVISASGRAYLHFDTRNPTLAYRIKCALPDFLLPWPWRRGIRRIRRKPEQLVRCFTENGLRVIEEFLPNSAHHKYLLRSARDFPPQVSPQHFGSRGRVNLGHG